MAKQKTIKVINDEKEPVAAEVLATSIVAISAGMRAMLNTKLNQRAVLVLLKDATGVSFNDINKVIDGLRNLEKLYLK